MKRGTMLGKVEVNKEIKPLDASKRKQPQLIIGNQYYVCFTAYDAYPCTLLEVLDDAEDGLKHIKIAIKRNSETTRLSEHHLFSDEIGRTPEEAVKNKVML
jgi:hypothetical protein